MKKLLLLVVFVLFGLSTLQSQTFKIGASIGLPTGDSAFFSTFVLGADAYYYFSKVDAIVEIGATAGFRNFFGDKNNGGFGGDDTQFLPIAGAARVKVFGLLSGGLDLGWAYGFEGSLSGGLYYRPVVSLDIADTIEINTSFEGINAEWGNFNVGILFEF